jgi:hypothetical protein
MIIALTIIMNGNAESAEKYFLAIALIIAKIAVKK